MTGRRFIAGAVCPNCGQMDKLVMLVDSDDRRRECVGCGYQDALELPSHSVEPTTRVNQPRINEPVLPHEEEIQPLKIMPLKDSIGQGRP